MESRRTGSAYDTAASQFPNELGPDSSSRAALEKWSASLPAGGRVLDVGCGAGGATRWLEAHGYDVLSSDVSAEMLRRTAAGRPEAMIVLSDMRALPVATGAFDGLCAFFSVTHIPKAEVPAVFAEFKRALRPSGTALIGMVQGDGDEEETPDWTGGQAMHFSGFREAELAGLLTAAGFETLGSLSGESVFHGQAEVHLFQFARSVA